MRYRSLICKICKHEFWDTDPPTSKVMRRCPFCLSFHWQPASEPFDNISRLHLIHNINKYIDISKEYSYELECFDKLMKDKARYPKRYVTINGVSRLKVGDDYDRIFKSKKKKKRRCN